MAADRGGLAGGYHSSKAAAWNRVPPVPAPGFGRCQAWAADGAAVINDLQMAQGFTPRRCSGCPKRGRPALESKGSPAPCSSRCPLLPRRCPNSEERSWGETARLAVRDRCGDRCCHAGISSRASRPRPSTAEPGRAPARTNSRRPCKAEVACCPTALKNFVRVGFPGPRPKLITRVEPDLSKVARPYPCGVAILELGVHERGSTHDDTTEQDRDRARTPAFWRSGGGPMSESANASP